MKKVRKIEVPKKQTESKKLKVAAYCRVSTKYESQKSSIELQVEYYTKYIEEQVGWEFAGIFMDYGSRCRIKGRETFQSMLQKALNGEIDFIITKSISRFSGNTVDMLQTIRKLKEKGIAVWFEKEDLRSTDDDAEKIITICAAFAQEEVRNMSENIAWGFQSRFEQGITLNNYKNFYGYDVIDGELVINKKQAEVVRNIFEWYLAGLSLRQIKNRLELIRIKTAAGNDVWHEKVILGMLSNEKYMGDSMLQKSYTQDYLTGKRDKNDGQKTRYYVYDTHKGIISKEKFFETACEIEHRKRNTKNSDGNIEKMGKKYNGKNLLANILICKECGASFRRRTERGKVVYRCATRMDKGREACGYSPTIEETWIKEELGKRVCVGEYVEEKVRKMVDEVRVGRDGMLNIERK
jgi:site-specific DNA recombinase